MNDQNQSSTFRLIAEPGKWTGAALRGLVQGGTLSIELTANGQIAIYLFDSIGYSTLPNVDGALLSGETADEYRFAVVIASSGDYYLVIDNRRGTEIREATVRVSVTAGLPLNLSTEDYVEFANTMLSGFEAAVKMVFRMDALHLRAAPCGTFRVVETSDGIILSTEFSKIVFEHVADKEKAMFVLLFTVFQEIGRLLLAQSKHRHDDLEASTDEVATGLMVMLGYQQQVRTLAEYFAQNPNASQLATRTGSDPYLLTRERAQKVVAWVDDAELLRRWQPVLVPNMQTNVLQKLKDQPQPWTSAALIEQELAKRAS